MTNPLKFAPRLESLDDRCVPSASGKYAVGAGPGGPPRVQIYESVAGAKIADFLAFENNFTGGVTTAMGDVNNDGFPDLVVGAGNGGGPRIRVFNGALLGSGFNPGLREAVLADFFVFEATQRGGVNVATGSFFGLGFDEVVAGAGPGGGPRVRILNGQSITTKGVLFNSGQPGDVIADFFAFEPTFRNGVTVAANPTSISLISDLAVAPGFGGAPRVRLLSGVAINANQQLFTSLGPSDTIADFFSGDKNTRAGLFVGNADVSGDGVADLITGTGPGIPGVVTVFNGAAMRNQQATYTGNLAGDRIDTFTPIVNYANGVTVGTSVNNGGGASGLLYGTGGAGLVSDSVFSRYTPGNGIFVRQVVFNRIFDPGLFIGVNVSN